MRPTFSRVLVCATGLLLLSRSFASADPPPGPLTLQEAVKEALQRNLRLLAERYNVAVAEAGLITAGLRPNPVLSFGGDHLDLVGTGFDAVNNAGPPEYSIRTDFVFERGAKRARRIELAQNGVLAAQLQFLNSVRRLILVVQEAFVDLQLAKARLELAEESLRALTRIAELDALRVKAGDLAEVELVRTRIAALQYRSQVRKAELEVRKQKNRLQLLLGRTKLRPDFDVTGEFRFDRAPLEPEELRATAARGRPDLQALRRQLARTQADLRLQLAQGKVDYVLGVEYRRQQGLAGTGNSLGLFFHTNLPIFNRNQGEIERALREQRQIEARLREREATVGAEVETAYQECQTARMLLEEIERDMLGQARDVWRVTEYSYVRGEATLIEFLDAQRAFNETLQAFQEARAEYARSLYRLDAAVGRSQEAP